MIRTGREGRWRLAACAIGLVGVVACSTTVQPMPAAPDLMALPSPNVPPTDASGERRGTVYADSLVDVRPDVATVVAPIYPEDAFESGLQGWVALEFVVGPEGRAEPASILVLATSDSVFTEPARVAILQTQYVPGRLRGVPVRVLVRQMVFFAIGER